MSIQAGYFTWLDPWRLSVVGSCCGHSGEGKIRENIHTERLGWCTFRRHTNQLERKRPRELLAVEGIPESRSGPV